MTFSHIRLGSLERILYLVFGALPATLLSIFATIGLVIGAIGVFDLDLGAVGVGIWSLLAIFGTYGLWQLVFRHRSLFTVISLCCGILAVVLAIIVWWPKIVEDDFDLHVLWLGIPPVVVAVFHVIQYFRPTRK